MNLTFWLRTGRPRSGKAQEGLGILSFEVSSVRPRVGREGHRHAWSIARTPWRQEPSGCPTAAVNLPLSITE